MARPRLRSTADRAVSAGSFHAGAPIPTLASFRRPSAQRYQTFPSQRSKASRSQLQRQAIPEAPSESSSRPSSPARGTSAARVHGRGDHDNDSDREEEETPLPVRQLLLLAFLSLSEQTALNSISPYLPDMVASMPGIAADQTGLYVGVLASAFALAQLSTNFLWGYTSDIVGRKPVLLAGTFSLTICFCFFGFCKAYWQVVVVHVLMGLLNGNAACVPTVLGEVTDRSNQSKAFTYLPVIYSLGGITGPALGGILVGRLGSLHPYLGPNVLSAIMLAISVIVVAVWFEETLDGSDSAPWQPHWFVRLVSSLHSWSNPKRRWSNRRRGSQHRPLLTSRSSSFTEDGFNHDEDADDNHTETYSKPATGRELPSVWQELLNHTTIILLGTYLMFQLSNISFNSLYPIFAAFPPPVGRELNPSTIGISLSLAGLATIIFQSFLYQRLKSKMGNLGTYRFALLGIAISMMLIPWVGYLDAEPHFGLGNGRSWLYSELGFVLVLKNICAVGGLSSVMLLITNSAPSHNSLGTLNGVAQTLSALGRSIGPFASGSLFTLSINIRPKGEAMVWSIFGGLALFGWLGSLFIRGSGLESEDWESSDEDEDHDYNNDSNGNDRAGSNA